MGAKFGIFKYSISDIITSYDRNLEIIDREYRPKIKRKNNIEFIANEKFYKYRCLNCGNEDWIIEHSLSEQYSGCNACCLNAKKVVRGVNDVTTTAPWMIKYFINGAEEASKYKKYSKKKINMICPDCGTKHYKSPHQVYSNGGLSCPCGDGWSYPNKFMYHLLKTLKVNFEPEKIFEWSEGKVYDEYINYNGTKIIIEQHGRQHYERAIMKGLRSRTVKEEQFNDKFKECLALENGIDYYFVIDSSKSSKDYIKDSILKSGVLELLGVRDISDDIWFDCDKFATSNFTKEVCIFKSNNPGITLRELADKYKVSYPTVLKYIKTGNKFGWCNYNLGDDIKILSKQGKIQRGQKPIHCITNDMYYKDSNIASQSLTVEDKIFYARQIRQAITRNSKYLGYEFIFISQQEFNKVKMKFPKKVIGDFFKGDIYGKGMQCKN